VRRGWSTSKLSDIVPAALLSRIEQGVQLLESARRARILCHYDPDGAAAAATIAKTLSRKGKEFHVTLSSVLDEESLSKFKEEGNDLTIVADMGSGQLEMLERLNGRTVVLDHHKPHGDSEKIVHVNPHLIGLDGVREVCGASLAWIFSLAVDETNWNLAGIAMAGAIGDRQHVDGFTGLNAELFKEAESREVLVKERMLSLRDMPLADALSRSLSPYLVGLTGRREACVDFANSLGMDPDVSPRKLPAKDRRILTSMLAIRLLRQGAQPEAIRTLVEEKYWMPERGIYVEEMSALINSCSRMGREGLGVSLALGDTGALKEAEVLRDSYFKQIIGYLHDLEKGMFKKKCVQFFYCPEPTLAGAVAGIGMQYYFNGDMPVIGFSVLDKTTKVSSRGNRRLVAKGLDLSSAMNEAAAEVGGQGGGHNIAAGATIPKGKEEKFVALVDEIAERQMKTKETAA